MKNPVVYFVALLVIALVVIVTYQISTDPFSKTKQGSGENAQQVEDLRYAMALYTENCSPCHGASGEGLGGHPRLKNIRLSADQIKNIIRNGRGNMPSFPGFTEQDLDKLANLVTHF